MHNYQQVIHSVIVDNLLICFKLQRRRLQPFPTDEHSPLQTLYAMGEPDKCRVRLRLQRSEFQQNRKLSR